MHTGKGWMKTEKGWVTVSQGKRTQEKSYLSEHWSWTSSPQNCEKINFCCLTHPACVFLWQPYGTTTRISEILELCNVKIHWSSFHFKWIFYPCIILKNHHGSLGKYWFIETQIFQMLTYFIILNQKVTFFKSIIPISWRMSLLDVKFTAVDASFPTFIYSYLKTWILSLSTNTVRGFPWSEELILFNFNMSAR